MKVKLTKGHVAAKEDIVALQQRVGDPLSPDFLNFIMGNDGAEPELNSFQIDGEMGSGVNGFIPVKEIPGEMAHIENLPSGAFPVAWDDCGNFVLINQAAGGIVMFWDHEEPDNLVKIADSFRSFIESLEPFDGSTVQLDPSQVKKVWIDPDFLKSL